MQVPKRQTRCQAPRFAAAIAVALATCVFAASARADMGPCKPDAFEGLLCGSGKNSARVINDTISPDKRHALAWRAPGSATTEQPDTDDLELLLVRLADGAVLATRPTEYWDTGNGHVNRLEEEAVWSPNSHYVLRAFQSRFATD